MDDLHVTNRLSFIVENHHIHIIWSGYFIIFPFAGKVVLYTHLLHAQDTRVTKVCTKSRYIFYNDGETVHGGKFFACHMNLLLVNI